MADILARQRQIVGTSADWAAHDLTLGAGEIALERRSDGTLKAKIGDGLVPFSGAPYLESGTPFPPVLIYRGNADVTAAPPAGAAPGDLYTAAAAGTVAASWGAPAAGTVVAAGDMLAKDTSGAWNVIPFDSGVFVTVPDLAASTGAAMVGTASGDTVEESLANAATISLDNLVGAITDIVPDFEGSGRDAITHEPFIFYNPGAAANDYANVNIVRRADYTGGSGSFVNSGLLVYTEVAAGAAAFEWALTARIDNAAIGGENAGLYMQGNALAGAGPTWAGVGELIDFNTNPTSGRVGLEVAVRANGANDSDNRVVFDAVVSRRFSGGAPSGAAGEFGYGFRVNTADAANTLVKTAFGIGAGVRVNYGLDLSLAAVFGDAVRIKTGDAISFDGSSQHRLSFDGTMGLVYKAGGNQMVRLTFYGTIETKANTFAGLPPPTAGNRGFITDCNSATYNAVAAGGGTNKVPVFGDGAAWRVG